jgi:hypothetical protein
LGAPLPSVGPIIHQKNLRLATIFLSTTEPTFVRFFRLALYGFNEGVPFVEAQSDSDLPSDAHLQPGQFSPDLLATPPAGVSGMPLGVPVLSVKVGRLTGKFPAVRWFSVVRPALL